ncbi:hypothetical protein CN345_28960 [Bacillus thuringiensis]|nr:hypothetical protein CN345_28960 [Bacillus thuringiensis]PGY51248.1 hypothetical protein COE09_17955 [Bacillus thuringiensis]
MSSGQIIEVMDEYRKRFAPLTIKWHEWKEQQPEKIEEPKGEEKPEETAETEEGGISKSLHQLEEFGMSDEDKSFEEEQEYIHSDSNIKFTR